MARLIVIVASTILAVAPQLQLVVEGAEDVGVGVPGATQRSGSRPRSADSWRVSRSPSRQAMSSSSATLAARPRRSLIRSGNDRGPLRSYSPPLCIIRKHKEPKRRERRRLRSPRREDLQGAMSLDTESAQSSAAGFTPFVRPQLVVDEAADAVAVSGVHNHRAFATTRHRHPRGAGAWSWQVQVEPIMWMKEEGSRFLSSSKTFRQLSTSDVLDLIKTHGLSALFEEEMAAHASIINLFREHVHTETGAKMANRGQFMTVMFPITFSNCGRGEEEEPMPCWRSPSTRYTSHAAESLYVFFPTVHDESEPWMGHIFAGDPPTASPAERDESDGKEDGDCRNYACPVAWKATIRTGGPQSSLAQKELSDAHPEFSDSFSNGGLVVYVLAEKGCRQVTIRDLKEALIQKFHLAHSAELWFGAAELWTGAYRTTPTGKASEDDWLDVGFPHERSLPKRLEDDDVQSERFFSSAW